MFVHNSNQKVYSWCCFTWCYTSSSQRNMHSLIELFCRYFLLIYCLDFELHFQSTIFGSRTFLRNKIDGIKHLYKLLHLIDFSILFDTNWIFSVCVIFFLSLLLSTIESLHFVCDLVKRPSFLIKMKTMQLTIVIRTFVTFCNVNDNFLLYTTLSYKTLDK